MNQPTRPVAQPARPSLPTGEPTTYLGHARVLASAGGPLRAVLEDDAATEVVVQPALTFPYEPHEGDVLLVLGQPSQHFAVGVIAASKPQGLTFPGETRVHASQGRLVLSSDQAVELRAPRVSVRTGLLRTIATRVVEKAGSMRRWVRGVFALRAGESRRLVDGLDSTRCENSTTLAKDTVKIDGDQLHLGH
jgi:hypothetical protein